MVFAIVSSSPGGCLIRIIYIYLHSSCVGGGGGVCVQIQKVGFIVISRRDSCARIVCGFPEPRDRGVGLFLLMVIRIFLLSLVVSQISLTFLVILSL